jgi:hypothetical protein
LVIAGNPTSLLGPDRPGEVANRVPGPVDDVEDVRVGVGPDGAPTSVVVDQQLTLSGVGDFSFKEPGPAIDVVAPAGAGSRPGLRRGSVIWEGFSPGGKTLAASVTLDPATERSKLPVGITVTRSAAATEVRITNQTGLPVTVSDGEPDRSALDVAASRALAALAAGRAPIGGAGGVPAELPTIAADSPVTGVARDELAPVRVRGTVSVGGGAPVTVDAVLPSARLPDGMLRVPVAGTAAVHVDLSVAFVLPDRDRLADAAAPPRARLAALQDVIWQGLRAGAVAAYLGNPRPGTSSSTFHFISAAAPGATRTAPRPLKAKPAAIALALAAALAVALAGAAVWSRS